MIETLNRSFKEKSNYFWSITSDNILIVGGRNQNRNFGEINLNFINNQARVGIEISDGFSSSKNHSIEYYQEGTYEYDLALSVFKEIETYLSKSETHNYQDFNRLELMKNTFNFLPKF